MAVQVGGVVSMMKEAFVGSPLFPTCGAAAHGVPLEPLKPMLRNGFLSETMPMLVRALGPIDRAGPSPHRLLDCKYRASPNNTPI